MIRGETEADAEYRVKERAATRGIGEHRTMELFATQVAPALRS